MNITVIIKENYLSKRKWFYKHSSMINANFSSLYLCYSICICIHNKYDAFIFSVISNIQRYEKWLRRHQKKKSMCNVFFHTSLFNFLQMHTMLRNNLDLTIKLKEGRNYAAMGCVLQVEAMFAFQLESWRQAPTILFTSCFWNPPECAGN